MNEQNLLTFINMIFEVVIALIVEYVLTFLLSVLKKSHSY